MYICLFWLQSASTPCLMPPEKWEQIREVPWASLVLLYNLGVWGRGSGSCPENMEAPCSEEAPLLLWHHGAAVQGFSTVDRPWLYHTTLLALRPWIRCSTSLCTGFLIYTTEVLTRLSGFRQSPAEVLTLGEKQCLPQLPNCCCLVTCPKCPTCLNHVQLFCNPMDCRPSLLDYRFLSSWDFPGKHTGVGCHFLL